MRLSHKLVLPVLLSLIVGCATNPDTTNNQTPRRQANQITTAEIQQAPPAQNALDLIRSLRPHWLETRGVQSLGRPTAAGATTGSQMHYAVVYVDGSRLGPLEVLRQIQASQLQEARFLNATEASSRFGSEHLGGAILITTRR